MSLNTKTLSITISISLSRYIIFINFSPFSILSIFFYFHIDIRKHQLTSPTHLENTTSIKWGTHIHLSGDNRMSRKNKINTIPLLKNILHTLEIFCANYENTFCTQVLVLYHSSASHIYDFVSAILV